MREKQNLSGYLESFFDNNSKATAEKTDEVKKARTEEVKKTGTEEESDLERIIGEFLR